MTSIRRQLEEDEARILSPLAALSSQSRGRARPEAECDLRPAFQHDRDRILHSKAFRRLKHKSQVFLSPTGDHYRTRLTHTLEVSQIARTVAKSLRLNQVLNEIVEGGFRHNEQSLRVVDVLEDLNLTAEVRDGILKHSKGQGQVIILADEDAPLTLEGMVVRAADITAYICHDIDDAIRAGVLTVSDLPADCLEAVGRSHSERIGRMVRDIVFTTLDRDDGRLHLSPNMTQAMVELRVFLYQRVYGNPAIRDDLDRAERILAALFVAIVEGPEREEYRQALERRKGEDLILAAVDFVAGMTDRYALSLYDKLFLPRPWAVL